MLWCAFCTRLHTRGRISSDLICEEHPARRWLAPPVPEAPLMRGRAVRVRGSCLGLEGGT